MGFGAKRIRSPALVATTAFLGLLTLGGCETPPSGIPTEASIHGLKPSGHVTMTQFFVSGSGVGSGTLTFRGRNYPFTLIGSLEGLGALATTQASGEVYKLNDLSQFSGAWIQGNGNLAISVRATGELWLENNHGVVMRLNAEQAGLSLSAGRYTLFIELSR
ncbi:MAG TPA: hypothetical protein VF886_00250 [Roseiarcus sp.]|jgi:hypothetical protein